jgi:hypothetical protein
MANTGTRQERWGESRHFGQFNLMGYRTRGIPAHRIYDDAVEQVKAAEQAGFAISWFAEHHFSNYCVCPSPLMMIARLAGETSRIKLGSGVVVVPLYHPVRLMSEIGMVDSLTHGRLYLGGRGPDKIDLGRERLLSFNDSYGRIPETTWLEALGLEGRVAFRTSSTRALLNAAMAGAGLALLPDLFARRAAGLVAIPVAKALPSRTPWLVVHRDLRAARRLRTVRAWIVQSFRTAIGTSALAPRL